MQTSAGGVDTGGGSSQLDVSRNLLLFLPLVLVATASLDYGLRRALRWLRQVLLGFAGVTRLRALLSRPPSASKAPRGVRGPTIRLVVDDAVRVRSVADEGPPSGAGKPTTMGQPTRSDVPPTLQSDHPVFTVPPQIVDPEGRVFLCES